MKKELQLKLRHVKQMQTVISLSNNKTVGQIYSTPLVRVLPALFYKTLSVVRYIALIGAGGLFYLRLQWRIILLGVSFVDLF